MFAWIATLASRLSQSRDGAVAIQVGLLAVVLIGFSALAVEIGFAYSKQRQMQTVADAAATGGAAALSDPVPDPTLEARSIAGHLGFVNGVDGVTVTVNNPPLHGAYDNTSVEVIIQQPQTLSMANLVTSWAPYGGSGPKVWTVWAKAVATNATGTACIIALDTGATCNKKAAINIWNNAIIQPTGCNHCGLFANSSCPNALNVENNAQINAPVLVNGQWVLAGNAKLNCTPKTQGAPTRLDPYADRVFSTPFGLLTNPPGPNPHFINKTGHYGPVTYGNKTIVTFDPGVYYIDRLTLGNGSEINAQGGVTLVITGDFPIDLGNKTVINITAPTSGTTKGIAIASIRTAPSTVEQRFNNGQTLNVDGAIYFPNQLLLVDNVVTIKATGCNQFIAKKIDFRNNAALDDTACPSVGGTAMLTGSGSVQLVE